MYFFYQRNFKREWMPCKTPDAPNTKSVNGTKLTIAGVRKLEGLESDFDLDSLAKLYPINAPDAETNDVV